MQRWILLPLLLLLCMSAWAQNTLRVLVRDDDSKLPLPGAAAFITTLQKGASADTTGTIVITGIPNGEYEIKFSSPGHLPEDKTFVFPLKNPDEQIIISLDPVANELAEVVVQTMRSNLNSAIIPTLVEALPADELDEKSTLQPGNIKMLLGEATGVYTQPTSAISGAASFRIEGLDSRYTQLLQDGLPLYQGFSAALSLLQVSPLNLQQVEMVKGPSSTLYGGGAIAGLINLISKTPAAKPELNIMLNADNVGGQDASGFYSQKWKSIGSTLFASYDRSNAYAPSGTEFSAIPKTSKFTLDPKIFFYPSKRDTLWLGVNGTYEDRLGGDMEVINGMSDSLHQYFEHDITWRFSTQFSFTHQIDSLSKLNFKNAYGYFNRSIGEPGFVFAGRQNSSYTEFNYVRTGISVTWVAGADVWTDDLKVTSGNPTLGYYLNTYGVFAENTWHPEKWFSVETGLRVDKNTPDPQNKPDGVFILPRINTLFNISEHFTARLGGGEGYKMPNLFNDESDETGYQYLKPLNIANTRAEQAYGANLDVTYKQQLDDALLSVNELLFTTKVNSPLILQNNTFVNAQGYLNSTGSETMLKVISDDVGLYLGYTYTDARQHFNGQNLTAPLTPGNLLNADVTYEVADDFRAGIEGFYTGSQVLSNGGNARNYWVFGILVQKSWKRINVFFNAENLTDQRQTKWGPIYSGTITKPTFTDIYAPLDGRIINAGVKLKLFNR